MGEDQVGARPVRAVSSSGDRIDMGGLLGLINGVLAGISGVYLATRSVLITIIAGGSALVVAWFLIMRR